MLKYDKAVFIIFILASFALAQIPQTINYQGYLTDSNGNPLSGNYNIQFSIYNSAAGGTAIWSETHNSVTVTNGVFDVILGAINPVPLELFDGTDKFLGITVGTDPEMTPRQKFTSVGYAFRAGNANDVKGANIHPDNIFIKNKIQIGDPKYSNDPEIGSIYFFYKDILKAALQSRDWGGGLWLKYNNNDMASLQSQDWGGGLWLTYNNNDMAVLQSQDWGGGLWLKYNNNDMASLQSSNSRGLLWLNNDVSDTSWLEPRGLWFIDGNGNSKLTIGVDDWNSGGLWTSQSDNDLAVSISTWRTNASNPQTEAGWIAVYDENGNEVISLIGNDGSITANIKNFRIDYPNDPTKEIYYSTLEGPEAAVYIRGTGKLINGEATIALPDYFQLITIPDGITVQLTPLSANSKGLAVVSKSNSEIRVKELFNGNGSYTFDYFVQAVRKGYENYQVVRDKIPSTLEGLPQRPSQTSRGGHGSRSSSPPSKPN